LRAVRIDGCGAATAGAGSVRLLRPPGLRSQHGCWRGHHHQSPSAEYVPPKPADDAVLGEVVCAAAGAALAAKANPTTMANTAASRRSVMRVMSPPLCC